MPTTSGLTSFGIIRKRMADLYADFALRIKEGGVFGTQTTADMPDTFPTDPLVQIMTTSTASLHELWEVVEFYYAQLDINTASGIFLDNLHGVRAGITRVVGQSDSAYREIILAALRRPTRNHIETVAAARPDIDCAVLLTSTTDKPILGVPVPGNALVVKGCAIDYNLLAQDIYNNIELGPHQLHGTAIGTYAPTPGSCVVYRFLEAQPLFAAIEIKGYLSGGCEGQITDPAKTAAATASIKTAIVTALTTLYGNCGLGVSMNASNLQAILATIPGFTISDIKLGRRARQLWGAACTDFTAAAKVTVCGTLIPWTSSAVCGATEGEVWCAPQFECLPARPWEYIAIDEQFITIVLDPTLGGCV